MQLLDFLARESTLERIRTCHRVPAPLPSGDDGAVEVVRGESGARFRGFITCDSVHACPVCAPRVRQEKADEIGQAARAWVEQGGGIELVSLTLRHNSEHSLAFLWDALQSAWERVNEGRWSERDRERFGIAGAVRAFDVTYSDEHGWHPHLHLLVFTRGWLTDEAREELFYGVREREPIYRKNGEVSRDRYGRIRWRTVKPDGWWRRWVQGLRAVSGDIVPTKAHGIDVSTVVGQGKAGADSALEVVARYVSGVGLELARMDLKHGGRQDGAGSRTPFELLAAAHDDGDADALRLWHEWEQASSGRRSVTWPRRLRAELAAAVAVSEDTDDLGGEDPDVVWTFSRADLAGMLRARRRAAVLGAAASSGTAGVVGVLLGLNFGPHDPEPPAAPRRCSDCETWRMICAEHAAELGRRQVEAAASRLAAREPLPSS